MSKKRSNYSIKNLKEGLGLIFLGLLILGINTPYAAAGGQAVAVAVGVQAVPRAVPVSSSQPARQSAPQTVAVKKPAPTTTDFLRSGQPNTPQAASVAKPVDSRAINVHLTNNGGFTPTDCANLERTIEQTRHDMERRGYTFSPPTDIYLGDTGKGSFMDGKVWYLDNVNPDTIQSKVFQTSLLHNYSNLNYSPFEGFSIFLSDSLSGPTGQRFFTYNPAWANVTGNDIYNASNETERDFFMHAAENNSRSIAQSLADMASLLHNPGLTDRLIKKALKFLNRSGGADGPAVLNALLNSTNNQETKNIIRSSFKNHGITC